MVGRKEQKQKKEGSGGGKEESVLKKERATWVLGYHASASAPVLLDRSSIRYVIRGSRSIYIADVEVVVVYIYL